MARRHKSASLALHALCSKHTLARGLHGTVCAGCCCGPSGWLSLYAIHIKQNMYLMQSEA